MIAYKYSHRKAWLFAPPHITTRSLSIHKVFRSSRIVDLATGECLKDRYAIHGYQIDKRVLRRLRRKSKSFIEM